MDDQAPSFEVKNRTSKRGCIGCLLIVFAVGSSVTAFVYFEFHPRDRVEVSIEHIPVGTRFLCLVADTDSGLKAMDWSPWMIAPFRMPASRGMSSRAPDDDRPIIGRYVMWDFGSRYGVIRRDIGQKWWITWFRSDEITIEGRTFVLGGGTVEFDVTKGKTEELPPDAVRGLGFEGMRWEGEQGKKP